MLNLIRLAVFAAAMSALAIVPNLSPATAGRGGDPVAVQHAIEARYPDMGLGATEKGARASLICLATAIYHEARGTSERAQIAVAAVIRNRSAIRGDDICTTTYRPGQFVPWSTHSAAQIVPKEANAWKTSISIAHRVLIEGEGRDMPYTNFYSGPAPYWARHGVRVTSIGQLHFLMLPYR